MIFQANKLVLGYEKPLNKPCTLSVNEHEWLGVIGHNGIGKSTFLKTLLGMIKPWSGELQVLGMPVGKANRHISYIPQEREINLTENMTGEVLVKCSYLGQRWGIPLPSKSFKHQYHHIIELVGANDYMDQPFVTLSGGQKKRIFLAQSLINEPKLLLLDEPLADLDPQSRRHFIEVLQTINARHKLSLLIISHDMHEIASDLNGFIHFKNANIHYCNSMPCVRGEVNVSL